MMKITIGNKFLKSLAIGLITCFSFCMQNGFAQSLQTITNRKDILIGQQIELTIKANLPVQSTGVVKWVSWPDSIPHFDVVQKGKIDTVSFNNNTKNIQQVITFTSFDSGRWQFPSLPVQFAGKAGQAPVTFNTDSFYVNVSYSPPDSTNQLRDIKPIIKVSVKSYLWYYIIGAVILLLLLAIFLYKYFKKDKKETTSNIAASKLSPVDEAMQELEKLMQLDVQDAATIKQFHTSLSAIFKNYLGRKLHKQLTGETTGDILVHIKSGNMQQEDIVQLATALRCTDAVKFAKYMPLPDESKDCLQKIKQVILQIENFKALKN
ncbi:MAG: hypothetical protein KF825_07850 [Ferruginibacter sp.]|nr:hypothetical protein [Ferruginibacter sp.]